jgi:DNA-binding IclR family transcriptional regulator
MNRGDRNRSLERGIEILRAFRPGSDLLGNGELADRTGLSRATVSRLAQTLVGCGLLEHDRRNRAYRLAAPVLSLAHAMRAGSPVLNIAGPLMRDTAIRRKINVGLSVADGEEMVYLESVRYSRRVAWRNVVAGQRVPMELTSLGRAWLSAADPGTRRAPMERLRPADSVERLRGPLLDLAGRLREAVGHLRGGVSCLSINRPESFIIRRPHLSYLLLQSDPR